jgi:hypothetical protein
VAWAPDYITVDELADFERIDDDDDDAWLAFAVTAASRAIDDNTRRQFGKVDAPEARVYTAEWTSRGWLVRIDDLMTTTGLVVKVDTAGDGTYATTLAAGDVIPRPRNAVAKGKAWTELLIRQGAAACPTGAVDEIQATAPWGWTTVPDTVKEAALLQGNRFAARRDAPFGVAGSPDTGSEIRLLAKADPDVALMLNGYRRRARPR